LTASHDRQFYLDQIKLGKSHRQIGKLMKSSVEIRDSLLLEGIIVLERTQYDPKSKRTHSFYKMAEKKTSNAFAWEDGTPKSRGNAFDITSAKGLFSKAEIANSINKGKPNNYNPPVQVIAYSRA